MTCISLITGDDEHLFICLLAPVYLLSLLLFIVVFQSVNHASLFVTPQTAACQSFMSFTISQSLLKLIFIESVMPSNHLILCRPLLLLLSIFPSIRVFSSESALHIKWPKYWSFSFSISPSNGYSGLISFRIDWFDILAIHTYKLICCLCIHTYKMVWIL